MREHHRGCGGNTGPTFGEGPVAADAHTPLLCSLRDLYTTDQDGFFDGLVQELLTHDHVLEAHHIWQGECSGQNP